MIRRWTTSLPSRRRRGSAPHATTILHMAPRQTGHAIAPLMHAARAGRTESAAAVTAQGLAEVAATPVLANGSVAGLLLVGSSLDGDELRQVSGTGSVGLAIFRDGRMISTTLADPDVVHALRSATPRSDGGIDLALDGFHYAPVAQPLPD